MTKYCPSCGEALVDEAKFCKSCGKSLDNFAQSGQNGFTQTTPQTYPVHPVEKSHTLSIVLGYICAILIPLFGLIFAVYLMTRNDSQKAKKHGKYILILTVVIWVLSIMYVFMGY
ncbi:hypothetical protein TL18_04710 [Methanobrevibacter sp. YE315]|uniref:zinc-ribbon domain-containing protein n=1 Tax=Methanobrevibacter sp. YE315 TaxID=1609968 RepID=UPI000764D041|nr:zinc-ribbon domain-containing protein [Methanobrevibacter sp. YE315]AMD17379.1 hypothetical protein TL18_04710 [Methanobrevibacter sp. YE315]